MATSSVTSMLISVVLLAWLLQIGNDVVCSKHTWPSTWTTQASWNPMVPQHGSCVRQYLGGPRHVAACKLASPCLQVLVHS